MMDFDLSKENIQPLRGGRNVQQLGIALQAQTNRELQMELLQQKEQWENLIRTYDGDDPLENYYNFISWIEQSYPKHGHEGNLFPLLEHCLELYENDKRYTNDRRFCKLFIKYFDLQSNPLELYHMMKSKGLCNGCADLYKAWAYYYEAAGDFQNANKVFEEGKKNLAQPYEELENAHENLIMAAGQHVLYGPDQNRLMEKRQALTSLHTYRPGRVGSVRVPSGNGLVTVPNQASAPRPNTAVSVYENRDGESLGGAEAAPMSIIEVARRGTAPKENTLKPGPWTTVPVKKRVVNAKTSLGFTVHEDEDLIGGLNLPPNHPKETFENYSNWRVSICYPEPPNPVMIPMYPKERVYVHPNTEYSIEELRSYRYLRRPKHQPPLEPSRAFQTIINDVEVMDSHEPEQLSPAGAAMQPLRDVAHHSEMVCQSIHPLNISGLSHNVSQRSFHNASVEEQQALNHFSVWSDSPTKNFELRSPAAPKAPQPNATPFTVYEQTFQTQIQPKGSAMKTTFKVLNVDELAETGSRGGMDVATTAQAADSAKPMPLFSDNSSSSFDDHNPGRMNPAQARYDLDTSCSTAVFNFNLNAMQVSTPKNKRPILNSPTAMNDEDELGGTRKQLFTEPKARENQIALSTILEETKSGRSSSSSGTLTKSSVFSSHNKMGTISEEYNRNLEQNLMANAELRSSLMGVLDFESSRSPAVVEEPEEPFFSASPVKEMDDSPLTVANVGRPLEYAPSDPFKPSLISHLLESVSFPGIHTNGYITINTLPKIVIRKDPKKDPITIGCDKFSVEKQLGKGTFGTVYKAFDVKNNTTVALKLQKPANKWEFYVCRELQARLADHPLRDRFMDVSVGYFNDQGSILVSTYMAGGSLLDLANAARIKSGKLMKEVSVVYFGIQMLKIVQAMHKAKIIHADIKPDNFLVYPLDDHNVGLQLIDLGCSIDMTLFPPNTSFTRRVTTENFTCCEMLDGRPWNYHHDMYCIAATVHVLLFDSYIKLKKVGDVWSVNVRYFRYMKFDLWNMFFSALLNQQAGVADSAILIKMLNEAMASYKEDSLQTEMRFLVNILKNR